MLHINLNKTCQLASETFEVKSVKGKDLQSEWSDPAEIKLIQAFTPVLVTSNFDDDLNKSERASMETPFSH